MKVVVTKKSAESLKFWYNENVGKVYECSKSDNRYYPVAKYAQWIASEDCREIPDSTPYKDRWEALEASIETHEENIHKTRVGSETNIGSKYCPLCVLFNDAGQNTQACNGCPIKEKTGKPGCKGTPWVNVLHSHCHGTTSSFIKAETEMIDFLKSLRPTKEGKVDKKVSDKYCPIIKDECEHFKDGSYTDLDTGMKIDERGENLCTLNPDAHLDFDRCPYTPKKPEIKLEVGQVWEDKTGERRIIYKLTDAEVRYLHRFSNEGIVPDSLNREGAYTRLFGKLLKTINLWS